MIRAVIFFLLLAVPARAGEVAVAVAANFRAPLEELGARFAADTSHRLRVSAGATGQLYAQIVQGAPFDVFLAADQARPAALEEAGLAVPGSRLTYAAGRLCLLLRDAAAAAAGPPFAGIARLSIANPRTAPYGAAAVQAIAHLGLEGIETAQAQSVAGVNAAFAAGAVDAGFAAWSTVARADPRPPCWPVPAGMHDPIRQDAVLLTRAADSAPARAFLDWLAGAQARAIIRGWGYD